MLQYISFFIFLVTFSTITSAQVGTITGKVVDKSTGENIIGVNVLLTGTTYGAATDIDGMYTIKSIPEGTYSVRISYISYASLEIRNVQVKSNEITNIDAALTPESIQIDDIVVTDHASTEYEAALLNQQKKSIHIVDGISAEQIKKSTDNTTAEVLRRAPGITLLDNKYIYVRGVSERYNGALLNNSPLASSEPDKKDFAFDLIPANLIENTLIFKSFTPDEPGDFAGGLVKVSTIEFPSKTIFSFNYSSSFVNDASTKSFATYNGGETDFLGLDDGTRDIPDDFPDPVKYKNLDYRQQDGSIDTTRYGYSASLNDKWGIQNKKAFLDQSVGITYGDRFTVFENDLGIVSSLTYKTGFVNKDIITRDEENEEDQRYFFDYSGNRSTRNVYWGGLVNLSYKLGEHHKIGFKNTITISSDDEVTRFQGFKFDYQDERKITALRFVSRNLYSGQIAGSSFFPVINGLNIDWRTSYSSSFRNEPDYRRNAYTRSIADSNSAVPFLAYIPRDPDFYAGGRYYSKLHDYVRGFGSDLSHPFGVIKTKFGAVHSNSSRSFNARLLSVTDPNGDLGNTASGLIGNYDLDSLYARENFINRIIWMREYYDPQNDYTSTDNLVAYYFMAEIPFEVFDQNIVLITGLRIENYVLRLRTTSSVQTGMNPINVDRFNNDLLPAFSLIYRFNEEVNIRFSFSKTINRPQFREVAPFVYYNFEDQTLVHGNTELKQANISNYDLRFEVFPDLGELISFSIFLKELRNPIEKVFVIGTGQNDRSFENSSFARNAGFEIEYRTSLAKILELLDNFTLTANYSRIWSEIEETNIGLDRKTRPMQGQSPYVINLALSYRNTSLDFSANLSYNKFGKRIVETANFQGDDLYEASRDLIDFVLSKGIGEHIEFKFTVKDLLEQPVEYFEEDRLMRSYSTNTKVSLGVSYKL